MAISLKPVDGGASPGVFHKGDPARAPWIMLPHGSAGMTIELDGAGDAGAYDLISDAPTIIRVQSVAGGPKRRFVLASVNAGAATLKLRKGGRSVVEGGKDVELDVAVLEKREVQAALFLVEILTKGGSIKSMRSSTEVTQMINDANDKILRPQANVTITKPYGPAAPLLIDLKSEKDAPVAQFIRRDTGIAYREGPVRDAFAKRKKASAHLTVFCVQKLSDPEAFFREEQFCLIEDGATTVFDDISYGAYCLAHATGHLLRYKVGAPNHSETPGELMFSVMEQGGPRIPFKDALQMNEGAGKL